MALCKGQRSSMGKEDKDCGTNLFTFKRLAIQGGIHFHVQKLYFIIWDIHNSFITGNDLHIFLFNFQILFWIYNDLCLRTELSFFVCSLEKVTHTLPHF